MNSKSFATNCFCLVLLIGLSACKETLQDKTSIPPTPTRSPTLPRAMGITPPTLLFTPTASPSPLPTFTLAALLPTSIPLSPTSTSTPLIFPPTLPALPTQSLLLPEFPLNNYRVILKKEEALYFQNGDEIPVKFTDEADVTNIIISDDNQRVAFLQTGDNGIYFIDSDGSNKQSIFTTELPAGENGPSQTITFVPYTHLILNAVIDCKTQIVIDQGVSSLCGASLYLIDADTGQVKELISPTKHAPFTFKVSPDGKNILVLSSGKIDIIDINGSVIRENILPYTPSTPAELIPEYYWLSDSSGLIIAIPDVVKWGWAFPPNPSYSVWQYKINGRRLNQMILHPAPKLLYENFGNIIDPSPDGHWMLYRSVESSQWARYLVNLETGEVGPYTQWTWRGVSWSGDSRHFLFADSFLGSIEKSYSQIGDNGYVFNDWIDESHYTYFVVEKDAPFSFNLYVAEISRDTILHYKYPADILLIKPRK